MKAARFIGETAVIRIDDKAVEPGDVVTGPADVVEEMLKRQDFELVDVSDAPNGEDEEGDQ